MKTILIMHEADNVGNCLEDLEPGDSFKDSRNAGDATLTCVEKVPFAFKVALQDIPKGGVIIKYGEHIGEASQDIRAGECVHVHNIIGKRA